MWVVLGMGLASFNFTSFTIRTGKMHARFLNLLADKKMSHTAQHQTRSIPARQRYTWCPLPDTERGLS